MVENIRDLQLSLRVLTIVKIEIDVALVLNSMRFDTYLFWNLLL